ncbi:MAG: putative membrane protein YphA (DoxX/SURF4 family), partial [Alphaproteobacteria bacterium]
TPAQTTVNGGSIQNDLSVIVDGDKVVPHVAEPEEAAASAEVPKLELGISRKTGRPFIKVAQPSPEQVNLEVSASQSHQRSTATAMPAYGPDGAVRATKAVDDGRQGGSDMVAKIEIDETKDDLRQIAKAVALTPESEFTVFQKIRMQFDTAMSWTSDNCQKGWTLAKRFLAEHDIHKPEDVVSRVADSQSTLAQVALSLRIGLGALFVVGGFSKLSQLLSPAASDAMVTSYTSTSGYINEFFMGFLFGSGAGLTPWSFLTALSAFELITGAMLLAGLLVRPIALIYAFLLWTFVISLPVVTTNGIDPGVKTYMAPAMLVQIRDIALSGMMFVLYGLGSGIRSVDYRLFGADAIKPVMTWDVASLLLRLSVAVVLLVGGLFAGMPNIKTFIEPGLLLVVVALAILWGGLITRYAAGFTCAVLLVYMLGMIGFDKGLIGNLNGIKRELALFAGVFVMAARECGQLWTATDLARRLRDGTNCAIQNLKPADKQFEPAE